jgi:hypothetical protein
VLLRFAADAADPRVVKAISAVIALLGMMWFVERLSAL